MRTSYKDEIKFRDPRTWSIEKEIAYQTKIHMDAVNEAKDKFDRKAMEAHSKAIADAAEKSHAMAFPNLTNATNATAPAAAATPAAATLA